MRKHSLFEMYAQSFTEADAERFRRYMKIGECRMMQ